MNPSRIDFVGRTPSRNEHLKEYARIDIALDPFPYNGTTTTCEALWMGIPVIALAGRAHVSRVSLSILHNAGLPELVAQAPEEYVQLATALAGEAQRLTEIRSSMRSRISLSPLRDEAGFARAMESEYRAMWRTWCSRPD